MTVPDVDIPQLINLLAGISHRVDDLHSLAYDPAGRSLDPDRSYTTGSGVNDDRPPIQGAHYAPHQHHDAEGNVRQTISITAVADTESGRRWFELIRLLRGAHHDLLVALQKTRGREFTDPTHNPLATNERGVQRRPSHITPRHVQIACNDLTRLLRPLAYSDRPEPLRTEMVNTAAAIQSADGLFPAHVHQPARPPQCRNPDGNDNCDGMPRVGDGMGLCERCAKLWDVLRADEARVRARRWCPNPHGDGKAKRVHANGVCIACYQRTRRARLAEKATA